MNLKPTGLKRIFQIFYYILCKRHFYGVTAPLRVLPDFLVIGVGRGGTTSCFHYLSQHPSIIGYNLIVGMIQGKNWEKLVEDNLTRIEIVSKDNYEELDVFLRGFMKGDYTFKIEFEGFCFSNLHRYNLDTQRVLYNVSQGRFFDKTEIPKGKWKSKWSPKLYTW